MEITKKPNDNATPRIRHNCWTCEFKDTDGLCVWRFEGEGIAYWALNSGPWVDKMPPREANGCPGYKFQQTEVYLSSSWKNRDRVRAMAIRLRALGHTVYDFTDPTCRDTPEIPPELFAEQFDLAKQEYRTYINKPEWIAAVECNQKALHRCDICVLMLPAGNDAHSDWAYAVGRGKITIVVGAPRAGDRTPTHLWADFIVATDGEVEPLIHSHANPWYVKRNPDFVDQEGE